jgi:hypothetical protein
LIVGSDRFAFDGTNIPAAAVARLERAVAPGTANTSIVTETHFAGDTFVVPPGALIPSGDGARMCVAHYDATVKAAVHARVNSVRVLGADESGAIVAGDFGNEQVLFNPGEMAVTSCP